MACVGVLGCGGSGRAQHRFCCNRQVVTTLRIGHFWNHGSMEAVLQVHAAYRSQDGRDAAFYQHCPRGPAMGRNGFKFCPSAG